MTAPLDPEKVAEHLDGIGETAAAILMRAMVNELAVVRNERYTLAAHTRRIAGLQGDGQSWNCTLAVKAVEALDVLRVTCRCPSTSDGRHWGLRRATGTIRCAWCHARVPETRRRRSLFTEGRP
ncbi:hypothetical protein [Streptomyces europaeiscabiei]|uniref:hypothetical protein n=1 Tax=Streptomyces europaeiscabiei TaxID=146819 RepID=UPI0038F5E635